MERKVRTDRELLSEYTSMWLPKKPDKHPSSAEALTEDVVSCFMSSKEYPEVIKKLRHVDVRTEIENEIEQLVLTRELTQDWSEKERLDKKLDGLFEELAEENKGWDC